MNPELKESCALVGTLAGTAAYCGTCKTQVERHRVDTVSAYTVFWGLMVLAAIVVIFAATSGLVIALCAGTYLYRASRDRKSLLQWARQKGRADARRDRGIRAIAVDLETKLGSP